MSHRDVHLVTWPRDAQLRERLARAGTPRMVLVESSHLRAANAIDELWVPASSTYAELVASADRLMSQIHEFDRTRPWIDEYGAAHRAHLAVSLSRPEAIVLQELLRFEGQVVPRARLHQVLEATGTHGGRALEGVLYRLRLRLTELRIVIRAARTQGFAVEVLGRTQLAG